MGAEPGRGTRDVIVLAAIELLQEDRNASLSVRTVAARAGVSVGSLRHHFPTQRALRDALLVRLYEVVTPADTLLDRSLPPRQRLLDSLREMLALTGVDQAARTVWRSTFEKFLAVEPTAVERAGYSALEREALRRIEYLLGVFVDEGVLVADDVPGRARFLLTVVNGLSVERALPREVSVLVDETDTLGMAVDQALAAHPDQTSSRTAR